MALQLPNSRKTFAAVFSSKGHANRKMRGRRPKNWRCNEKSVKCLNFSLASLWQEGIKRMTGNFRQKVFLRNWKLKTVGWVKWREPEFNEPHKWAMGQAEHLCGQLLVWIIDICVSSPVCYPSLPPGKILPNQPKVLWQRFRFLWRQLCRVNRAWIIWSGISIGYLRNLCNSKSLLCDCQCLCHLEFVVCRNF